MNATKKRGMMKIAHRLPAGSPALVVMAAGVVTASSEFTLDAVDEYTPVRLADSLLNLSDKPTARRRPRFRD
jgi:hypothetical protein